jgi:hypothetical protein
MYSLAMYQLVASLAFFVLADDLSHQSFKNRQVDFDRCGHLDSAGDQI